MARGLMGYSDQEMAPPASAPVGLTPGEDMRGQGMPPVEDEEEMANVDPADQAVFDQLTAAAVLLIYDEQAKGKEIRPAVKKMLTTGDNPAENLGEAAALIWQRVEGQAEKDGLEYDEETREAAQVHVFELLHTTAVESGIFPEDAGSFAQAFLIAADSIRQADVARGRMTPEQAQQDMQELQAASDSGQLDEILAAMGPEA